MDSINFSCQGESHIAIGKVCQDYSLSRVYENGNAIAIVCDGHGGKRYFRSDIGAKIAAEVTQRNVEIFIREVGCKLLCGTPFTSKVTISEQIINQDFDKQNEVERAFRQLFSSIIYEWNAEVASHAATHPIQESEKSDLEPRWVEDFEKGVSLEKVYGCTLIVFAYTSDYWFAFQIGDGKCFVVDESGNWMQPIPWDERCFLNKTTSICDSSAIDEFRYCYEGDGTFPIAIILGSDGIDDSFGAEENQANFYVQILKALAKDGIDATIAEIESTLPQLSKIGSQDDMSIAMVFNYAKVSETYPKFVEWQISNVRRLIAEENAKIAKANQIQQSLENVTNPTRQNQIDLRYAQADEKRAIESKTKLLGRLSTLMQELGVEQEFETTEEVHNQIEQSQPNDVSECSETNNPNQSEVSTEKDSEQ